MKKILVMILSLSIALSFVACSGSEVKNDDKADKNETGVNVEGSVVSWGNMEVDNKELNLTEDQIEVLRYFDNDYFMIDDYDSFQRHPEAYRNAQVCFDGMVKEILKTDDEGYTALVYMNATNIGGMEDIPDENNLIVVSGKHPEDGRIIKGDSLGFFGRYMDVQSFEIGDKEEYYPYVTVNYTTVQMNFGGYMGESARFDFDSIERVAKIIFGNNIKIKEPVYGEDFELDELHSPEYQFYLVTLDNQSNANFTSFEFSRSGGYIVDAKSTMDELRYFNVAADFEHYLVTIFNRSLNLTYMEYYDRDLNKIWSREFKGTENVSFDYTKENVYFAANNDFYVMDIETGEDKIEPVMVGEKIKVSAVIDGVILIGTGNKDNIMKVGMDGNIIWKTSANMEVTGCGGIQIVEGKVVANIFSIDDSGMNSIDELVVVDDEGNITSEFVIDEWYESSSYDVE